MNANDMTLDQAVQTFQDVSNAPTLKLNKQEHFVVQIAVEKLTAAVKELQGLKNEVKDVDAPKA